MSCAATVCPVPRIDVHRVFLARLEQLGYPAPVREHRFHDERLWRFDYAWPEERLALEVEGGVWTRGRHTRGGGFLEDLAKYNEAAVMGWRLIRVTPAQLPTDYCIGLLDQVLH